MSAPEPPEVLQDHAQSYTNGRWIARAGPLDVLRISRPFAAALHGYEKDLVREARKQGHSWEEIGLTLGMSKQAAHKQFRHIEPKRRPRKRRVRSD